MNYNLLLNNIWQNKELNSGDKVLMYIIVSEVRMNQKCKSKNKTLSKNTNMSVDNIKKILKKLKSLNLITISRNGKNREITLPLTTPIGGKEEKSSAKKEESEIGDVRDYSEFLS